jgi:Polyketide cyclase / dehydrase and lipid transport
VIAFDTSVRIGRPIDDVFTFVSDPLRFPRWNSAVQTVQITSGANGQPGSTYSMWRELPSGRAENDLEVFTRSRPGEFGIRTTSGPTPFVYHYRLVGEGDSTVVRLGAEVELPRIPRALRPLAVRGVRRGVDANFTALKRALEQ